MNANELVTTIENEVADAQAREDAARREMSGMFDDAERSGRVSLSSAETARSNALFRDIETAKASRRRSEARLERAREVAQDETRLDAQQSDRRPTGATPAARTASFSVGRNERTYHPGNDPDGAVLIRDVARALFGDPEAAQKLGRHMQEERVERPQYLERAAGDLTTSGLGGIVVPQYLVELTAPAVAARRPFADEACTRHQLPPSGLTFTVPTITTATSAALQATQLTAVSATSMGETDLTISVLTGAGSQNVSRQAIDRGVGTDQFVMADLMARYATVLDSTLINQATTGLSAKAASTLGSFTATAPTGALLYPKILAAQSGVEAVLLGQAATHVVMHSRRWAWLSKEMSSTWPMINSQGIPVQASGTSTNRPYGQGVRGTLPNGLAVVVDNNVPTNVSASQDEIYIVPQSECHLWEDPNAPMLIRAEQPNAASLGVVIVVYGYFAYTFDRYGAGSMQKVSGAGLTTPTF